MILGDYKKFPKSKFLFVELVLIDNLVEVTLIEKIIAL